MPLLELNSGTFVNTDQINYYTYSGSAQGDLTIYMVNGAAIKIGANEGARNAADKLKKSQEQE